jgi:ABC-type transporter Mla MlaB component
MEDGEPSQIDSTFSSNFGETTLAGAKIELNDGSEVLSDAMEQAAICYANNQIDDAIAILAADIETVDGHHALDTWLMLFDLYQMQGKRAEFDELALKFVVEFERSAPVWQDPATPPTKSGAKPAAKAGGPAVLFPAQLLGDAILPALDQIEKQPSGAEIRLELGRIQALDAVAASHWLARLPRFRKARYRFQLAGGPQLITLLRGQIEVMRRVEAEAPFWLLLLEIYQLVGLQEDFENTAVDYAVTFEVSPPSWDTAARVRSAAEVAAEQAQLAASAPEVPDDDHVVLQGEIVNATEATFQPVLDHALTHPHGIIHIDLSRVPRIDFVSCGVFMNVLVGLTAQSRRVELHGANELIVALFRIMGVTDVARVVRKK